MSITLKTQKMLWGRAAARCAFSNCRRLLVEDISITDDPTLVGENCHIIADSDDGPRGDPIIPVEDRNRYTNLILLCSIHHKIIDDNPEVWTVDSLRATKEAHESWVNRSLGVDKKKIEDDVVYASYVDRWEELSHLDNWTAWSSHILGSGQPRIFVSLDYDLEKLRKWMLGRIWPNLYPDLEDAFHNFRRVLQDFHNTLHEHLDCRSGAESWRTEKFYKKIDWDPPLYALLVSDYDFHVDIVSDLMLELTRAANLVCSKVRQHISRGYRLEEGHLIVQRGPDINLQFIEVVPLYDQQQSAQPAPYPGLHQFYEDRRARDWTIGDGRPRE